MPNAHIKVLTQEEAQAAGLLNLPGHSFLVVDTEDSAILAWSNDADEAEGFRKWWAS